MIKILKNKSLFNLIVILFFVFSFFSHTKTILADGLNFGYVDELNNMIICGYSSEDDCNAELKIWSNGKYSNNVCVAGVLCNNSYIPISPKKVGEDIIVSEKYTLLAPIGEFKDIETNDIGKYFNLFLSIAIGLAGALAVVMIIIGGIEWMGTDSVFGKTKARERITSAILGLLIALGSFALLNTINPDLLGRRGLNIDQVNIEIVDLPDAGRGESKDPDYVKGEYKYYTDDSVSSGVASALLKLKDGWQISAFRVYPDNNRMVISLTKGVEVDNNNIISISPGGSGYSEIGQGKVKDNKTPKGNWKILEIRKPKDGQPVFNKDGVNMGATFWLLNPTTNGERGIGMHGNKRGTLGETAGCLRLKNSDLLALLPYVKVGTPVNIID